MTTYDAASNQSLSERMTRLETAHETEGPQLATKADLERQTRLIIMWFVLWFVGFALTILGLNIGVFLYLSEQMNVILRNLP